MRLASLALALLLALSGCSRPTLDTASNRTFGQPKRTQVGRYQVGLRLVPDPPPLGELFRVEADVALKDGTPLETAVVTLNARMPEHAHGMETRPRVREGTCTRDSDDTDSRSCRHPGGTYVADGFKFHMSGAWTLLVEVDGPAGPDATDFVYVMP